MYKLRIRVTKEILRRSAHCEGKGIAANCAIALAVRDILPRAAVSNDHIFAFYYDEQGLVDPSVEYQIHLPKKARDFIFAFDRSNPQIRTQMQEMEFEVELPDAVIDKIGIAEATRAIERAATLARTIDEWATKNGIGRREGV